MSPRSASKQQLLHRIKLQVKMKTSLRTTFITFTALLLLHSVVGQEGMLTNISSPAGSFRERQPIQFLYCGVYLQYCGVCLQYCGVCLQYCGVCLQYCGIYLQYCGVYLQYCGVYLQYSRNMYCRQKAYSCVWHGTCM